MPSDTCILTTKDFTILETMLDCRLERDDRIVPLLRRKLNAAKVVFRDDVPADVSTLSSRVLFSVDGRALDTRIISPDRMTLPIGLLLPITTFRGLALLGLTEGQSISFAGQEEADETVSLENVLYQPEAARREKQSLERDGVTSPCTPILRLIRGAFYGRPDVPAATGVFEDPGSRSLAPRVPWRD